MCCNVGNLGLTQHLHNLCFFYDWLWLWKDNWSLGRDIYDLFVFNRISCSTEFRLVHDHEVLIITTLSEVPSWSFRDRRLRSMFFLHLFNDLNYIKFSIQKVWQRLPLGCWRILMVAIDLVRRLGLLDSLLVCICLRLRQLGCELFVDLVRFFSLSCSIDRTQTLILLVEQVEARPRRLWLILWQGRQRSLLHRLFEALVPHSLVEAKR